jgi:hypothetical protein
VDFDRKKTFKQDFGLNQKIQLLGGDGSALIDEDFN